MRRAWRVHSAWTSEAGASRSDATGPSTDRQEIATHGGATQAGARTWAVCEQADNVDTRGRLSRTKIRFNGRGTLAMHTRRRRCLTTLAQSSSSAQCQLAVSELIDVPIATNSALPRWQS